MSRAIEAVAVVCVLTGLVLLDAMDMAIVGALFVAAGAYGLVLPQFIRREQPVRSPH